MKGVELFSGVGVFAEGEAFFEHAGGAGFVVADEVEVAHRVIYIEAVGIVVDVEVEEVEGAIELMALQKTITQVVDEVLGWTNGVAHAMTDPGEVFGEERVGLVVRLEKSLGGEVEIIKVKQGAQAVVFGG